MDRGRAPMRKLVSAGLAALALAASAAAFDRAEAAPGRGHGSLQFLVGFPVGEFGDSVDETGFGVNLDGGYRPGRGPVVIGARAGFMTYGNASRREPFNPNIPEVTIRVETSNNLALGHAYLRLQPPRGSIRPYVDGLVGFTYLWTESRVESERFDEEIAASTNFDDTVFSFGVGYGLHILLGKPHDEASRRAIRGVFLEVGGEYIRGGEARYLKKGSVRRVGDPPRLVFEVFESRTDLATLKVGAAVEF